MKYSTGRGTMTKHSTAMEWTDYDRKVKKRSRIKHSTGRGAAIAHTCGIEIDMVDSEENEKTMAGEKSSNKMAIDY